MPLFKIVTHSVFENVYLVESSTEKAAIAKVEDYSESVMFMQRHLKEPIVNCDIAKAEVHHEINKLHAKGYY